MTTGVVIDRRYEEHAMGAAHVESPDRLRVLRRLLEEDPPVPYLPITPRPATGEDLGLVHERGYIDLVRSTAGQVVPMDGDTVAGPKTWEAALLAAGGLIEAVDRIMAGAVRNALALVRPPGHHAEASRAMGFCFFNNAAIAAEHLVRRHGLSRVLAVDWDLHHGNGTEQAFYERRDVLYFSSHQVPLFPGTGATRFFGHGEGFGYNLNVPLLPGKCDDDFLAVYEGILAPVAAEFQPEFVVASVGYDIAAGDPLGGMEVTAAGFGRLTASLAAIAERTASGRLALVLEGGYDLGALRAGVSETLRALDAGGTVPGENPRGTVPCGDSPSSPSTRLPLSPALKVELQEPLRTFRRKWDIPDL